MFVLPYVESDGVKIYYEVEGEGVPLMLHHGRSSSLKNFRGLWPTERLRQDYKLILIDARGHGRSDKPHQPDAYRLKHFVDDTISVLNELGIERSHFLGYSMGGRVGLGIGVYSPRRFMSLIIGGMGIYETDSEEAIKNDQESIETYKKGIDVMFSNISKSIGKLAPDAYRKFREEFYLNDPEALIAISSLREHVGYEDILPSLELPCLFFAGEKDYWHAKAERTAELIQNARFVSLPGLDHMGAVVRSDLVLPHVLSFLADIE